MSDDLLPPEPLPPEALDGEALRRLVDRWRLLCERRGAEVARLREALAEAERKHAESKLSQALEIVVADLDEERIARKHAESKLSQALEIVARANFRCVWCEVRVRAPGSGCSRCATIRAMLAERGPAPGATGAIRVGDAVLVATGMSMKNARGEVELLDFEAGVTRIEESPGETWYWTRRASLGGVGPWRRDQIRPAPRAKREDET